MSRGWVTVKLKITKVNNVFLPNYTCATRVYSEESLSGTHFFLCQTILFCLLVCYYLKHWDARTQLHWVTCYWHLSVNFYPHFPHLLSNLVEIRHKISAVTHSGISWKSAQRRPCIFACINKLAFRRVPRNLMTFVEYRNALCKVCVLRQRVRRLLCCLGVLNFAIETSASG